MSVTLMLGSVEQRLCDDAELIAQKRDDGDAQP